MKIGFDNNKYIELQSQNIRERISQFGGKLYLEFGGKLFDDYHASRVLPGFEPDSKLRMLSNLKNDVEMVIVINAADIEKNKMRGDLGITYDEDVLRLKGEFEKVGFYVVGESAKPTVKAYRCYLTAPASEIKAFFFFDDDDVTGINGVDAENIEIEAIYTINGTKVNSLQKGLNIVKMSNGKVKKVMVP